MALVTITEASKLTKKNRTTLYRYIKDGKLSKTTDETGKDKLDTSELLRVFGVLQKDNSNTTNNNEKQHEATNISVAKIQEMQHKIQQLEQQLLSKDELLKAKGDHIDSLKQALMLLEHKKDTAIIKEDTVDIPPQPTEIINSISQPSIEIQESEHITTESVTTEKPKRKKFLGLF